MTSSGTVVAVVPAGVATDVDGNGNTASSTIDNTVTFVSTPPSVSINQAVGQADPTSAGPIHFTVVFDEPVSGFETGDVTLSGTAGATTAVVTETTPGTTYDVAVSGMTSSGTVVAVVSTGVATDVDGNGNTASSTIDNTVTFEQNAPASATVVGGQCSPTITASGTINLALSDPDGDELTLSLASNSNPMLLPSVVIGGAGTAGR